jgi:hypothetical protein
MFPFWLQTPAHHSAAPAITGFLAGTPDFGSAAGQTPAIAPVITGSNFTGATSVLLSGVEHISDCTVTSTSITVNTILSGTAIAFGTVSVVTPGGTANYGDGSTVGWTYLPAGYHLYAADFVGVSGSEITQFNDVGDLTADNLTGGTIYNLVASGINGRPTAITTATSGNYLGSASTSGWTAGHSFYAGSGNGMMTGSNTNGIYAMGASTVGTYCLLYAALQSTDFGSSSSNYAQVDPVSPVTVATINAGFIFEESLDSSGNYAMVNTGVPQTTTTGVTVSFNSVTVLCGTIVGTTIGVQFGAWLIYPNTTLSTPNRAVVTNWLSGRYSIALL